MTPNEKREFLKTYYNSMKWANRVDTMSDKQVHAVYMRLINKK